MAMLRRVKKGSELRRMELAADLEGEGRRRALEGSGFTGAVLDQGGGD